ncbi:MAG: hypothetical protein ACTH4W_06900 [Lactococcus lactis]|jgi:FtsZ-binding cell division protein ZapB
MKNQLLLEAPKQDHEIIITKIEAANKLMKDPKDFSKWSRVKAHIKRNKGKYIARALLVGASIATAVVVKNQHDKIENLKDDNDGLREENAALYEDNVELCEENDELRDELADAEAAAYENQQAFEELSQKTKWVKF